MVQLEKVYTKEDPKFLPPYGDGTNIESTSVLFCWFSPPYGDGTGIYKTFTHVDVFSPPYGDGTDLERGVKVQRVVFAPLRGWDQRALKNTAL